MRIALIGGNGFIGRNLAEYLFLKGYEVLVFDKRLIDGNIMYRQLCFDLSDSQRAIVHLESERPEIVIHLADNTLPITDNSTFRSNFTTNISSNFDLFWSLQGITSVKKIIYFSSGGTIYGESNSINPLSETSPTDPISLYGWKKLALEKLLVTICKQHGLDYLILRPSNPYGKYQIGYRQQGIVATTLYSINNGEPLHIWGDENTTRDYIWIDDLVKNIELLICYGVKNEIINLGTGLGTSIKEVIQLCEEITGN